jgi:hypothetical protein
MSSHIETLNLITLKVELLAGSDIRYAVMQVVQLSERMGVCVEAKFNDVTLLAYPDDNPIGLLKSYYKEVESTHTYKIARDGR